MNPLAIQSSGVTSDRNTVPYSLLNHTATFTFMRLSHSPFYRSSITEMFSKAHVLSEDVSSLSRNSKESLDVLGDLESRVQKLRDKNMHGSSSRPWADRQVDTRCYEDGGTLA